jgi:hypothetical protein
MPADTVLAHVRTLIHAGHVAQAIGLAAASAGRQGVAALDQYRAPGGPVSAEESLHQFLVAVQAAAEALDRIALGLVEGE